MCADMRAVSQPLQLRQLTSRYSQVALDQEARYSHGDARPAQLGQGGGPPRVRAARQVGRDDGLEEHVQEEHEAQLQREHRTIYGKHVPNRLFHEHGEHLQEKGASFNRFNVQSLLEY